MIAGSSFTGLSVEIKIRGSEADVASAVCWFRGLLRVTAEGQYYPSSNVTGWKIIGAQFKQREYLDAPHIMAPAIIPLALLPQAARPAARPAATITPAVQTAAKVYALKTGTLARAIA